MRVITDLFLPLISVAGEIDDRELAALLRTVYVDAGFTDPEVADKLFAPAAVRDPYWCHRAGLPGR